MKEIRKVLEWIASKFSKTTEPASEPDTLGDSIVEIHKSLGAIDDNMVGYYAETAPEPPQEANDRPTTVIGWLETLPDGYRELAIKNNYETVFDKESNSLSNALDRAFYWREAPEGFAFWNGVSNWVGGNGELPPLPQPLPNDSNDSKFKIVSKDETKERLDGISPLDDIGGTVKYETPMATRSDTPDREDGYNYIDGRRVFGTVYHPLIIKSETTSFSKEILEQALQTCIATENYELCAEIKAQLDKLNQTDND